VLDNKAEEYRRQAQAFREVAERVSSPRDRERMLAMANRLLELALEVEKDGGQPDSDERGSRS